MIHLRFLVTGGAGFIGSNLVEALLDLGEVMVVDDLSTGNEGNIKPLIDNGAEFHKASILDYRKLVEATQGVDYVFHHAALASVTGSIEDPVKTNAVNVSGSLNVLEASRKNQVKKVVFASSSAIYGDTLERPLRESMIPNPLSPYAISKLSVEYYCSVYSQLYGLPTVCLRYFNVYGPKQDPASAYSAVIPKFITLILEGNSPTIFGDGSTSRDFVYVKDVVQANIQSIKTKAEGVFNIAYGKETSLNELANIIMNCTGKTVKVNYGSERIGDVQHSLADISKATDKLEYNPKYEFEKGLKKTIEWYKRSTRVL